MIESDFKSSKFVYLSIRFNSAIAFFFFFFLFTSDKGGGTAFVCLLARLLKNVCMDLDEMLCVNRCWDMDELINFWARSG